ncbi:MAG: Omp28-related outer membrane protein [Prevotella sp.]|nr:Omp28-related outer membrane protein [Prevotella sp.]
MKRTITLLAACAAVALTAGAQTVAGGTSYRDAGNAPVLMMSGSVAAAPQKKITLETGERVLGFYDTDELPNEGSHMNGWVTYPDQTIYIADVFETDMTDKFVGGKITKLRFGIAAAMGSVQLTDAFIMEINPFDSAISGFTPKVDISLSATVTETGWYEVELPEPLEIKENKWYMIGYGYYQDSNACPIMTDGNIDTEYTSGYGFISYFKWSNVQTGPMWYSQTGKGQACIQAVVEGGDFADDDIALQYLTADKYAGVNEGYHYSFKVKNYGNTVPESYMLKIAVDDVVTDSLDTPITLTSSFQTVSGKTDISWVDTSELDHTFKVYVDKINGAAPEAGTRDDTLQTSFKVYTEGVTRQMHLIEQFTSVYCGWCPMGHNVLEKLQASQPGKYAWVALHGLLMGSDPMYITSDYSINNIQNYLQITGYPMAAFDRIALENSELNAGNDVAIGIGYGAEYSASSPTGYVEDEETQENTAKAIDAAVDAAYSSIPAFATVNISAAYDSGTRKATITVSGSGVDGAQDILADNTLTVYILEDGIEGMQEDYVNGDVSNGYFLSGGYVHNNVLRAVLPQDYGDDINWTSSSTYSNTYYCTLDSSWDADNIKIVAFIAGAMTYVSGGTRYIYDDLDAAYVNNCNMVSLTGATGIQPVVAAEGAACETARYTVGGTRISSPQKGVNIVRMSDGSVKKVIIK